MAEIAVSEWEGDLPDPDDPGVLGPVVHIDPTQVIPDILPTRPQGNLSRTKAVFNIMNSIVGAGTVTMPFVFKQAGIVNASLIIIMLAIMNTMTLLWILQSAAVAGVTTFTDLGRAAMGRKGRRYIQISLFIACLGTCSVYLVVMGDLLPPILREIFVSEDERPWFFSRIFVCCCTYLIVLLPLASMKDLSCLGVTSGLGLAGLLFMVVAVAVRSAERIQDDHEGTGDHVHSFGSVLHFFVAFPIVSQSYIAHQSIQPIIAQLREPDHSHRQTKNRWLIYTSVTLCAIIYFIIGLVGYLGFAGESERDILENFHSPGDILIRSAKLCLFTLMVVSYPIIFLPARIVASEFLIKHKKARQDEESGLLVDGSSAALSNSSELTAGAPPTNTPAPKLSRTEYLLMVALLSGFTLGLALLVPDIAFLYGVIGSTVSAGLAFIFPAAFAYQILLKRMHLFYREGDPLDLDVCDDGAQTTLIVEDDDDGRSRSNSSYNSMGDIKGESAAPPANPPSPIALAAQRTPEDAEGLDLRGGFERAGGRGACRRFWVETVCRGPHGFQYKAMGVFGLLTAIVSFVIVIADQFVHIAD